MAKRSTSHSQHSAGGPLGGYLYQLEFALVALFELKPGECLGVETMMMNKEQYQQRLRRIFPWLLGSLDQEYLDLKEQQEEAQRRLRRLERQNEEQEHLRRDTDDSCKFLMAPGTDARPY